MEISLFKKFLDEINPELGVDVGRKLRYAAICDICDRYHVERPAPTDKILESLDRIAKEIIVTKQKDAVNKRYVYLPKIDKGVIDLFGEDGWLIERDEDGNYQWSQTAVDFASMLNQQLAE
jgi:hypothetical protein